jgi:hypothetical protein
MKPANHLPDHQALVVEIEQNRVVSLQWCPLCVTALDAAVLTQRRPASLQSVGQPHFVGDVLGVVRKMRRRTMDTPPVLGKPFGDTTTKSAVEEELRLLE